MDSDKPFKIHLYKLSTGDESLPLEDILEQTLNTKLEERERSSGRQPYRLEDAEPPTKAMPFWLFDISKRRYEGGAGESQQEHPSRELRNGWWIRIC